MTIGTITLCSGLTLCLFILGLVIDVLTESIPGKILGIIVCITIAIGIWVAGWFYCTHTEGGKRALKTQQSNLNGGIERRVLVYDVSGNVIADYQGKFDVEYDDDRILFDDEEGLRHIIYYPTGTVIIDEIGAEEK